MKQRRGAYVQEIEAVPERTEMGDVRRRSFQCARFTLPRRAAPLQNGEPRRGRNLQLCCIEAENAARDDHGRGNQSEYPWRRDVHEPCLG